MNDLDYQILQLVSNHPRITAGDISKSLPRQRAVPLRIRELVNHEILSYSGDIIDLHGLGVLASNAQLKLTIIGCRDLEDYNCDKAKFSRKTWENRIWKLLPITISLIALTKSFWLELTLLWQQLTQR